MMPDLRFRSVKKRNEGIYREKGSKFISVLIPVQRESECDEILDRLALDYPGAKHLCYAWRIFGNPEKYKTFDAGEPRKSAGPVIYNQLRSYDLFNVLLVVIRIFGGTKLGLANLKNAYKEAARDVLSKAAVAEREVVSQFTLIFPYSELSRVMSFLQREKLKVLDSSYEQPCRIKLQCPESKRPRLLAFGETNQKIELGQH